MEALTGGPAGWPARPPGSRGRIQAVKLTMFIPAGEGERFAPGSLDSQAGKTLPLKLGDRHVTDVTVISAEVAEDSSGVSLTVEVPG